MPNRYRPRGEMTIRVVTLIRALMAGWRTVPELAALADSNKRTVYRYLLAMQSARLPLEVNRDDWNGPARYRLR